MKIMIGMRAGLVGGLMLQAATALAEESIYTKLDLDNDCAWKPAASEEEASMGGEAVCPGLPGYDVHFAEGDLRQFTAFGPVRDMFEVQGGFGQWNHVGETVEWRMSGSVPRATILRWFIENIDPETAMPTKAVRGQVLVVSTVASAANPVSCVAGYVDARANRDANELARQVADAIAPSFRCGIDRPAFHGVRGPLSGDPY